MGSEGLIAARFASAFVLNTTVFQANSKTIKSLACSRNHTLQLCAEKSAVMVLKNVFHGPARISLAGKRFEGKSEGFRLRAGKIFRRCSGL